MRPVDYKQTDPRWANNDYSAPGEKTTIAKSGCGPTCMAMALASLVDLRITPAEMVKWALQNGFKACKQGTFYTYFKPQGAAFRIIVERLNATNLRETTKRQVYHDQALKAIENGDWVICCMGPKHWTSAGHYILWYDIEGMNVLINDPATNAPQRAKAPLSKLQEEVKYYFVVHVPDRFKPKKDTYEQITVVAQDLHTVGYLQDGTSYVPVRTVAEALYCVVGWNPTTQKVTIDGKTIDIVNRDGVAYAPARVVATLANAQIEWKAASKTVVFKKG